MPPTSGEHPDESIGGDATFARRAVRSRADDSLNDGRTRVGDRRTVDTILDGIPIVDLGDRFTIERTLGQGGMGVVQLATDGRLGRQVAIKRILGEAAENRMAAARFLTEAKAIAALNHPNIVHIYEFGRSADGPFLIMEYVDGGSLAERCKAGPIPFEQAIDLACQICDGLARAHDRGIVHRDIKPSNILLTSDGIPKLTDFGLAKDLHASRQMTMTNAVMGTPDFMPPEQMLDPRLVDHRSDLWSLAATVYQMVSGRSPKQIRFDRVPAEVAAILAKALEEEQDARYQSAGELRDAFHASRRRAPAESPAAAGGGDPGEPEEGRCTACGAHNAPSRKFCRTCGGPLAAPCLSCGQPMPLWEDICGDCGGRQSQLVTDRRAALATAQRQADGLLSRLEFARAEQVARRMLDEPHPRLSFLQSWAREFLARIEQARDRQVARVAESLARAVEYEAAHEYAAAVSALESVPAAFRPTAPPGSRDTVGAVLERVQRAHAECLRLDAAIQDGLARRNFTGLEREIERLLALQPARSDLVTLERRLEDRRRRFDEATACRARGDSAAAITAVESIPEPMRDAAVATLLTECVALRRESEMLADRIRVGLERDELDGLLPAVDRLLEIRAAGDDVAQLRTRLVARRDDRLGRARTALATGDLSAACAALAGAQATDFAADDGAFVSRVLQCDSFAASLTAALRHERSGDLDAAARVLEALPSAAHAVEAPDGDGTVGEILVRVRAQARDARVRAEAEADTRRTIEACGAAGLAADMSRCRIDTTAGPLVLVIERTWSPHWALWFARAVKAGGFEAAAVHALDHGDAGGLVITPEDVPAVSDAPTCGEANGWPQRMRRSGWPVAISPGAGRRGRPAVVFNAPAHHCRTAIGWVDREATGDLPSAWMASECGDGPAEGLRAVVKSVHLAAPPECQDLASRLQQGLDLAEQNRWEESVTALRHAVTLDPDDVQGWVALGNGLRRLGRIDEGVQAMTAAVAAIPYRSILHYNLACYHAMAGNAAVAVGCLRHAITMRPEWQESARKDADFSSLRNDKGFLALLKDREPARQSQTALTHGLSLAERGRHEEAVAALRVLLERQPEALEACVAIGRCLRLLGRPGEAAEAMELGVRVAPRQPRLLYNLACYHGLAGRTTQALRALMRAVALNAEYGEKSLQDDDLKGIRSDPRFPFVVAGSTEP